MPTPRKDERKDAFISRCIPIVLHEGTTKDSKQAAAICFGIWERHVSNASALVLEYGGHKILVDFGERNSRIPKGVTDIIVTHAHPDHAFGLKGKQLEVPVYMNKFSNQLLSRNDFPFRRKIFWRKPFFIGDVKVTPIPVIHSVKAPASGLIFQVANRKLAYFPDVLQIHDLSVLKHCAVYIGDGASLDQDIVFRNHERKKIGHASIRTQLGWLKEAEVPIAIFTHYGRWAMLGQDIVRKTFNALEEEFGIKVWEAYGGYKMNIGRTINLEMGKLGRRVTLDELLGYCKKPIVLSEGYLTFTGEVADRGETEGTLDIVQKETREIPERDQRIFQKLSEILPTEIVERLQRRFQSEVPKSPASIYDLILVPSDYELVRVVKSIVEARPRSEG